ncbi:hypothetical protein BXY39_0431 [Eilatimonas milleporae]|uniref:Uncharacterized protein n=1 Tax=Eilatimonas milleporae TaxID=911205 RepID=A0A3M0D6N8_9PROT|nr:hypothetical protein BXY39_0431 [Eilatimonas milleporae]
MSERVMKGCYLKKEISPGYILTTLTVAIAGFWWTNSLETHFAVLRFRKHGFFGRL